MLLYVQDTELPIEREREYEDQTLPIRCFIQLLLQSCMIGIISM